MISEARWRLAGWFGSPAEPPDRSPEVVTHEDRRRDVVTARARADHRGIESFIMRCGKRMTKKEIKGETGFSTFTR